MPKLNAPSREFNLILSRFIKSLTRATFPKIILGLVLLSILGWELWSWSDQINPLQRWLNLRPQLSTQQYADFVMDKCADSSYHPGCYDEEIPKLMDTVSMEDAFKVAKIIQETDTTYGHCHVVGHKLSQKETAKDPSKWKEVITRCPTTVCNNGCLHGPILERFKKESLTDQQIEQILPDISDACEPRQKWHPVPVEISMCYHALGHLSMYVSNANINKSVDICKIVGTKKDGRDYIQTCTEGVFMQIFQGLDPEDFALVKGLTPKKEEVPLFCSKYRGEAFDACRRESWPLFFEEVMTPQGLDKFCGYTDNFNSQLKCYGAIMNMVTVRLVFDAGGGPEKLKAYCTDITTRFQDYCFSFAAQRSLQLDPNFLSQALSICQVAQMAGRGERCYDSVQSYSVVSFHPGSEEFKKYCSQLPSDLKKKCLDGANSAKESPYYSTGH